MTTRSIMVNVAANVAPYVGGMSTASAATGRFAAQTATMNRGVQGATGQLRTMGAEAGLINPKLAGAAGLAFGIKSVSDAAVGWESAFAGVTKTVDGTAQELDQLEGGLRGMSKQIPTSAVELASIAESAGQLGIETDNVEAFTRVIADLGETTNLVGSEGATQLARFANITQMSQHDFDRLGSTIVDLGNNFATTEAEIVDMGLRIAGAGAQVGMTEGEILAVATALSSVGIEAEAGGSAISRTMVEIARQVETGGDKLATFAEVAGMSATDFAAAWAEDPAAALEAFISGLGAVEESGGSTLAVLEDLEITEIRQRDALLRAAGAGDLLSDALDRQNDAWEDNVALAEEAAKRYGTTAAELDRARNAIEDLKVSLGNLLLPDIGRLARGTTDILDPSQLWAEFTDRVGDPFRLGDEDLMSPSEVWGRIVDDMPLPLAPWIRNRLPGGGAAGEEAAKAASGHTAAEESIRREIAALDELGPANDRAAGKVADHASAQDRVAAATRDALAAYKAQADELRAQTDPLFAAIRASQDYEQALADLDAVRQDAEASAQDLADAERRVYETAFDMAYALANVVDENGNVVYSTDQVIDKLAQMGVPPEVLARLRSDIADINGQLDTVSGPTRYIDLYVRVNRAELEALNAEIGNVATGGGLGGGGRTSGTGTVEQGVTDEPTVNPHRSNIPRNHSGGRIEGPSGWMPGLRWNERLRITELGETVVPAAPGAMRGGDDFSRHQMMGDVHIHVSSQREGRAAVDELRALEREVA